MIVELLMRKLVDKAVTGGLEAPVETSLSVDLFSLAPRFSKCK